MENPRVIGHIVAVQGFRVRVELLAETKSALRATLDGVHVAVAINAYLTFSIGAGQLVIGTITDLEARESYDPKTGDELTLELMKPRRVASVQLLGTIEQSEKKSVFSPGITILPTLDTPAEIGSPDVLRAVFETPPQRNRPSGFDGEGFDFDLRIGSPTGQPENVVKASYNDLFSRPLAIVGNTGSGKSYSVSNLVQNAMKALREAGNEPHIFILDINGEYGRAFLAPGSEPDRQPDHIYLNGSEFGIPLWFLNAAEICGWLSAAEQTQEPVLKDWWAIAKAHGVSAVSGNVNTLRHAITKVNTLVQALDSNKPIKKACVQYFEIIKKYVATNIPDGLSELATALGPHVGQLNASGTGINWDPPSNEPEIRQAAERLVEGLKALISGEQTAASLTATTADSPRFISRERLVDPTLLDSATPPEDAARIEAHLTTLKLRLKTRLDDPRWLSFLNYADKPAVTSLADWMGRFGLGKREGPRVSVIDLSMLSHEVLPYACTVIGRVLLEARENLPAAGRYKHPWVLVLEEAHNYARPPHTDEERGQSLSRLAFERIAKEGRKFGLSLVIASQRPSEISQTIISQCANFISHRLQNPDDIDHFRRIIPMQARRLLDQVTILASGEAIVFGSAFHVPTRVQFDRPNPEPYGQTAAPFYEWSNENSPFPLAEIVSAWGLLAKSNAGVDKAGGSIPRNTAEASGADSSPFDDDIPF